MDLVYHGRFLYRHKRRVMLVVINLFVHSKSQKIVGEA